MQSHCAALPLVGHLHLDAKHIAELSFERCAISIRGFGHIAGARAGSARVWAGSFAARTLFDLTNRESLGDRLSGQRHRVRRGRNGSRMPHIDIALQ